MIENILAIAQTLAGVPNAPYMHHVMRDRILDLLKTEIGLEQEASDFSMGVIRVDEFGIYVKIARGEAGPNIIVESHIDHPGFVLDGRGGALGLGSVGLGRIRDQLRTSRKLGVKIFNPTGTFIGPGALTLSAHKSPPWFSYSTNTTVPANSQAIWDVDAFSRNGNEIKMHAADNMIVTCVMLALISKILREPDKFPNLNCTFVFTFLEEVFEVSASGIALRKRTAFEDITRETLILVLECMQSVPLMAYEMNAQAIPNLGKERLLHDEVVYHPTKRLGQIGTSNFHRYYEHFDLPLPNHEDGVLIKINDVDGVYGFAFPDETNSTENLLVSVSERLGIPYQHTLSGGACNGTAYSLFPTTSNIATLAVPNPYKHNMDFDGRVVPEQIKIAHIEDAYRILESCFHQIRPEFLESHPKALASKLKSAYKPPAAFVRQLQSERKALITSSLPRFAQEEYFPSGLSGRITLFLSRLWAHAQVWLGI